jgi:Ca2+-binding EF-hand superfamily protein
LVVAGAVAGLFAPAELVAGQSQTRAQRETMRFRAMDRNGDGSITRAEWRGNERSFRSHDWNGDGVLAGDEVRVGAARPRASEQDWNPNARPDLHEWNDAAFGSLDRNRDGRITPAEWRYDVEAFRRADRDGNDELSRAEFLNLESDLDREDRFEALDTNNDGRVERIEWHGSLDAFEWMDRDRDGVLTRAEAVGDETRHRPDVFASLDTNDDGRVSIQEWQWSRRSFTRQDRNGDGTLSREELAAVNAEPVAGTSGRAGARTIVVPASQAWVDTGIDVRAGDVLSFDAEGQVSLSPDRGDVAGPAGASSGRRAPDAPLPTQPAGVLVARIGQANAVLVGDRGTFDAVNTSGRLYLGVNDDHFADNGGQFRVVVTVRRR